MNKNAFNPECTTSQIKNALAFKHSVLNDMLWPFDSWRWGQEENMSTSSKWYFSVTRPLGRDFQQAKWQRHKDYKYSYDPIIPKFMCDNPTVLTQAAACGKFLAAIDLFVILPPQGPPLTLLPGEYGEKSTCGAPCKVWHPEIVGNNVVTTIYLIWEAIWRQN